MIGGIMIGLGSYAAVNVAAYFTLGKPLEKVMERGSTFAKILTAVLAGPATLMNKIYPASKIKEKREEKKEEKRLSMEREKEVRRRRAEQFKRDYLGEEIAKPNVYQDISGIYEGYEDTLDMFEDMSKQAKALEAQMYGLLETYEGKTEEMTKRCKYAAKSAMDFATHLSSQMAKTVNKGQKRLEKTAQKLKKYRARNVRNNGYSSLDDINLGR